MCSVLILSCADLTYVFVKRKSPECLILYSIGCFIRCDSNVEVGFFLQFFKVAANGTTTLH